MRSLAIALAPVAALALSPLALASAGDLAPEGSAPAELAAPAGATDPVLQQSASCLTSYLAGPTAIQDFQPPVGLRAVNLDGSLRASPGLPLALAGNPFGSPAGGGSLNGVRLDLGAFAGAVEVDIALPADMPWIVGRAFCSVQADSGGHRDSTGGYNGVDVFQISQPELVLYKVNGAQGADDAGDVLYLVTGSGFIELDRVDLDQGTSEDFRATNGAAGVAELVAGGAGEPDTYAIRFPNGITATFFGFDADAAPAAGSLWKLENAAGDVAYFGDATTGSTAITSGFDASGRPKEAFDSEDRRFQYTIDAGGHLTQVVA